MCCLEEPPSVPIGEEPMTVIAVDTVDGALEDVLEEVVTEQVKQQLWECVVAALQRGVQWLVDRVQSWRQRGV